MMIREQQGEDQQESGKQGMTHGAHFNQQSIMEQGRC